MIKIKKSKVANYKFAIIMLLVLTLWFVWVIITQNQQIESLKADVQVRTEDCGELTRRLESAQTALKILAIAQPCDDITSVKSGNYQTYKIDGVQYLYNDAQNVAYFQD